LTKVIDVVEETDMVPSRKVLMMGVRNGYVSSSAVEIDNVVTNILEASAAVERESVLNMDFKKRE
jgi:hypothetical protein